MLIVKLMKYKPLLRKDAPDELDSFCVREVAAVHVRVESATRSILQLGDAPDKTVEVTVGKVDAAYDVAYIMNSQGKTVETIR